MYARHDSAVAVKLEPLEPQIDPALADDRMELVHDGSLAEQSGPYYPPHNVPHPYTLPPSSHFAPYAGYSHYYLDEPQYAFQQQHDLRPPDAPRLNRNLSLPHVDELMYPSYPDSPIENAELQYPQEQQHVYHHPVAQYHPAYHSYIHHYVSQQEPPASSPHYHPEYRSHTPTDTLTGRGLGLMGVPHIRQPTLEYPERPGPPRRTRTLTEDELVASGSLLYLHSRPPPSSKPYTTTHDMPPLPELSPSNTTSTVSTQLSYPSLNTLLSPLIPLEPVIQREDNELRIQAKSLTPPPPIFPMTVPYNAPLPLDFVDHPKRGHTIFNDVGVPIGWDSGECGFHMPVPIPITQFSPARPGKENKPVEQRTSTKRRATSASPPLVLAEPDRKETPPFLEEETRTYLSEVAKAQDEGWPSVKWPVPPDALRKDEEKVEDEKEGRGRGRGRKRGRGTRGGKKARITV